MAGNIWGYVIIWDFLVRKASEPRFTEAYGPAGDWARFFAAGEGYLGTELVRDVTGERRYVTLDFWTSRQAYERFREQHLAEYEALDARCQALTERETEIGRFDRTFSKVTGGSTAR
jgi:heme-degrading monooxygenase HmoA